MTADESTALADALRAIRQKLTEAKPDLPGQRIKDAASRAIDDLTNAAAELRWIASQTRNNVT